MIEGYDVATVRVVEDRVRAGLPPGALMQRAARALAQVVRDRAQELGARSVVVLAGPGDNGGDALWAASLLDGLQVTVVGVAARLHADGATAAREAGVEVVEVAPDAGQLPARAREALAAADLVVDGLLGIGGRPGLRGAMAAAVAAVPGTAYLVGVDLPSGADPAGEDPQGPRVRADETVTFGVAKPVHLLPATAPAVGRLRVVDIGLTPELAGERPVVERLEPADVAGRWPVPDATDHKYSRGVLGVVAGSDDYPGAAVLCCTAAVEAGAGMVRYLGPPRAADLVLASCPEVVPGPGRVQAMVVGPGVDAPAVDRPDGEDDQVDRVTGSFAQDLPLLVDAGGLELLGRWLAAGHRRTAPTLLTPHAGELARLLGTVADGEEVTRERVEQAPLAHARRAAVLTGCTVLLKGATTLVVDPDPAVPVRSQADAPPWLATAGAGDVLAGLAGVLLAAGLAPLEAGSLAALVHGTAASRATPGGPVRALGVAHAIPLAVADLLAGTAPRGR
ncbi:NAD(P)H-hydrate epimerase [uncultured Ornithinimicrobium sp.]|nr:NAD(P)H-hydrate epimerase [uncultured Ornithinimicrobium sp.]